MRAMTFLVVISLGGAGCTENSTDERRIEILEACGMNKFGAASVEECSCKLDIVEAEFGAGSLNAILRDVRSGASDKSDLIMLEIAMNDPAAAERASTRVRSECLSK